MVNKVVNRFDFKKDGVYKVPITYEEMDTYGQQKLDELAKEEYTTKRIIP